MSHLSESESGEDLDLDFVPRCIVNRMDDGMHTALAVFPGGKRQDESVVGSSTKGNPVDFEVTIHHE